MEITFQLLLCAFMGVVNCLILNFFMSEEPRFGNYLIALAPWFGNFYAVLHQHSIIGFLYSIFRVLEFPSILLLILLMNTELYNAGWWILIIVSFITSALRAIYVGHALWSCWVSKISIFLFEAIFLVESIYIFGILPYTLQNLSF